MSTHEPLLCGLDDEKREMPVLCPGCIAENKAASLEEFGLVNQRALRITNTVFRQEARLNYLEDARERMRLQAERLRDIEIVDRQFVGWADEGKGWRELCAGRTHEECAERLRAWRVNGKARVLPYGECPNEPNE